MAGQPGRVSAVRAAVWTAVGATMRAEADETAATAARRLMRAADRAVLATARAADGWPYASLVLVALDHDAAPLLLLSHLAEHTRNLLAEREGAARASLLFDGTGGLAQPLTGPRLTVFGTVVRTSEPRHRARFLARHPDAAGYAGFADFAVYRVAPTGGHLVAGFGAIHALAAEEVRLDIADAAPLIAAEAGIVAHMNEDHADAVALYATRLLGRTGDGWRMTGIDPEGCDLRRDGETARLSFAAPIRTPAEARERLVALVAEARAAPDR